MKRLLIFGFTVLMGCSVFAQEATGTQGVELPSFVITGEEKYELPPAEKADAPFVPIVSEEFLKPVFSPEFLQTSLQSDPLKKEFRQQDTIVMYSSKLEAEICNMYIPLFNYTTLYPLGSVTLLGGVSGFNQKAYDPYTGRYSVNPNLGLRYKVVEEGAFFNDNEIQLQAGYDFTGYKLFALATPAERKIGNMYGSGTLASSKSNFWQYNINAYAASLQLNGEDTRETQFKLDISAGFAGRNFEFNPTTHYIGANFTRNGSGKHVRFLLVEAPAQIKISDVFNLVAGLNFTYCDTITALQPVASFSFKMRKGFTFFASYNPGYHVITFADALARNNYMESSGFSHIYYPESDKITAGLSLEYERFFDIMFSFSRFSSRRYPYFEIDNQSKYTMKTADISAIRTDLDVRVYPSSAGYFYSSVQFQAITDTGDNYVPFEPVIKSETAYGYTLSSGINMKAGVNLMGGMKADFANNESMQYYSSIFLEAGYSFSQGFLITFRVNNLLNRKNYIWKQYREMPFDATAGIALQW
ncbi:MAG: TonB-dependent receptor [Ignavibacteriales bacterium]|nr:TonB-dependent receptor [Ignavibacteriales bacterium]